MGESWFPLRHTLEFVQMKDIILIIISNHWMKDFDELVDLVLKTLITLIASLILILNFLFRDSPNDLDDI